MFLKIKDRRMDGLMDFTDGSENLPAGPIIIMIARLSIFLVHTAIRINPEIK